MVPIMMARISPRTSSRALRRRRWRRLISAAVAALVILWSLGAGYLWQKLQARNQREAVPAMATAEQRAEAVRLLDEGVRARFEERWQGVFNAVSAARRADPQVRGIDILIGEIALEQKDPEALQRATARALSDGENEAAAKLLRAVETWMKRGEKGVDQAGLLADQYLAEAAESEPSRAVVRFFHGELSRLLGQGAEAHRHLRASLYRQAPWDSSALLEVKMQLAAREASDAGTAASAGAPTAQAGAALALREAVRSGASTASAQADLFVITPALQSADLLQDPALGGDANTGVARNLRQQVDTSLALSRPGVGARIEDE